MASAIVRDTFALEPDDLPGLPLSTLAGFTVLGGYLLVSPIADNAAALAGNAWMPVITVATLAAVAIASQLYQMLVTRVGMDLVMPIVYRILSGIVVIFAIGLATSKGDAAHGWSFALCIFTGMFSLYTQSTFWATMAQLHSREQAQRTYGIVAAGQQLGSIFAAAVAAALYAYIHYWQLVLGALLIEVTVHLVNCRRRMPTSQTTSHKDEEAIGKDVISAPSPVNVNAIGTASGNAEQRLACCNTLNETLDLMLGSSLLRMLTCHSFITNFLTAAIYYERAHASVVAFATSAERVRFFSLQNGVVSTCTLVLQIFVTGRLTKLLGVTSMLMLEPFSAFIGLVAYAAYPGLVSIVLLDGVRKVVHYSFLKPVRESIFSQLEGDVKFRAKAFIDAFVFRAGSASAAGYFAVSHAMGANPHVRASICLAVALLWLAVSCFLGRSADAMSARQPAADQAAPPVGVASGNGNGAEQVVHTEETPMLSTQSSSSRRVKQHAKWQYVALFALGAFLVVALATLAVTVCFTSQDKKAYCERSS